MAINPRHVSTFFEVKLIGAQASRDDATDVAGLSVLEAAGLRGQIEAITEPAIDAILTELPGDLPPMPSGMYEPMLLTFTATRYVGEWAILPSRYAQIDVYTNQRSGPAASDNTSLSNRYEGYVKSVTPQEQTRSATPKKLIVVLQVDHWEQPIGAANDANAIIYIDKAEQVINRGGVDELATVRANLGF